MKKFAVFDIDGTLIRWQLYHAVVNKLAGQGFLGKEAHEQLHLDRMAWKERTSADAFEEYESALIKIFESALPKIDPEEFDTLVTAVTEEYKNQIYTFTRDLVLQLKKKDYFLIAISGSHQELVKQLASYYGFDIAVGSNYERKNHKFSGKKFIASLNKKTILEDLITQYDLDIKDSIAVGDTKSDIPMLEIAQQPIAFNPEINLFRHAREKQWKIVVERKNMIYQLEAHDGQYVLA